MSQSFVSTNSFNLELGLGSFQIEGWTRSRDYRCFLRYPDPDQGFGYRAMRTGVIAAYHVLNFFRNLNIGRVKSGLLMPFFRRARGRAVWAS